MIEFRDVTKRYGRRGAGTDALRDVSLTFSAGSVWAVVGPNGAGKSTLLSLLLGFIRPSAGLVTIADDLPGDYLRERGAGYLPERFSLPPQWRTGEAIRLLARLDDTGGTPAEGRHATTTHASGATFTDGPAATHGKGTGGLSAGDRSASSADRAIDLLGLEPHLDKRIGELSRGLLQRVGLAQALLAGRSLIVLDEPTEGLDPVWRVRLRDIVAALRSEDRTIVIASHDLAELERIADRAVVLDKGAVREVLDVRGTVTAARYRIRLAVPFADLTDTFPGAVSAGEREYIVTVTGAAELSQRLGGLIALGAVLASVEPILPDLEERVRTALDTEA